MTHSQSLKVGEETIADRSGDREEVSPKMTALSSYNFALQHFVKIDPLIRTDSTTESLGDYTRSDFSGRDNRASMA